MWFCSKPGNYYDKQSQKYLFLCNIHGAWETINKQIEKNNLSQMVASAMRKQLSVKQLWKCSKREIRIESSPNRVPYSLLVAQTVENPSALQETWVGSLGQEDSLEKGMAIHSSILAWRIPWTEEPGGLQSTVSQRVGHNWATNTFTFQNWVPLLSLWLLSL